MLKEAKIYFDQTFKDEWCGTKIHYAGEEFDNTGLESWINISLEPVSNRGSVSGSNEYNFTFYVICWGDTEIDVMELGDDVAGFVKTNIVSSYMNNGYEIVDREWDRSNYVFMVMAFRFKTYSGDCA